jgi:hypothetical protein
MSPRRRRLYRDRDVIARAWGTQRRLRAPKTLPDHFRKIVELSPRSRWVSLGKHKRRTSRAFDWRFISDLPQLAVCHGWAKKV